VVPVGWLGQDLREGQTGGDVAGAAGIVLETVGLLVVAARW